MTFNPKQPRVPRGVPGGGRFMSVGAALGKLRPNTSQGERRRARFLNVTGALSSSERSRLMGRGRFTNVAAGLSYDADSEDLTRVASLRAGEKLVGKKKFGDVDHPFGVAVVDGPSGRTVRLAPIGWLDTTGVSGNELANYTGGKGRSSAILDVPAAGHLGAGLSQLAADAEARRKAIAKAQARFDNDEDEAAYAAVLAPYVTYHDPEWGGQVDGHFGTPLEMDTPWGTVVAQGYSDEMGDWYLDIGVRPQGAVQGVDWSLDGFRADGSLEAVTLAVGGDIPHGQLELKDVRALVKYLSDA